MTLLVRVGVSRKNIYFFNSSYIYIHLYRSNFTAIHTPQSLAIYTRSVNPDRGHTIRVSMNAHAHENACECVPFLYYYYLKKIFFRVPCDTVPLSFSSRDGHHGCCFLYIIIVCGTLVGGISYIYIYILGTT